MGMGTEVGTGIGMGTRIETGMGIGRGMGMWRAQVKQTGTEDGDKEDSHSE